MGTNGLGASIATGRGGWFKSIGRRTNTLLVFFLFTTNSTCTIQINAKLVCRFRECAILLSCPDLDKKVDGLIFVCWVQYVFKMWLCLLSLLVLITCTIICIFPPGLGRVFVTFIFSFLLFLCVYHQIRMSLESFWLMNKTKNCEIGLERGFVLMPLFS